MGENWEGGAGGGGTGVGIAFLIGGVGGVVKPGGEHGQGFGGASGGIEVAAEHDIVIGGKVRADQAEKMAGLGDAAGGVALDEVDADNVQGAGAGDGDGGPDKIAILDVGVVPLAKSSNGVAGNDPVGEAGTAFFAGEVGAGAQ